MNFVDEISRRIVSFFAVTEISKIIKSGDYNSLATLKGFTAVIAPFFPIITIIECAIALLYRKLKLIDYKLPFFSYVMNAIVGKIITIAAVAYCIGLFERYAILKAGFTWYWFLYAYVVWELGHFVFHYTGHKVRILWCLHSTHHAPENMNLSINFVHFFLENTYANIIRTTICILLGVNPVMLVFIMFIDPHGEALFIWENP